MGTTILPKSCIECPEADCIGYCKRLQDRQDDYALRRHKRCPLEQLQVNEQQGSVG